MRGIPSMRALKFCLRESKKNEERRLLLIKESTPSFSYDFWEGKEMSFQDEVDITIHDRRF